MSVLFPLIIALNHLLCRNGLFAAFSPLSVAPLVSACPALIEADLPEAAQPLSPNLISLTRTPLFTWKPAARASRYRLLLTDEEGAPVYDDWIDGPAACTADLCSFRIPQNLTAHLYTWKIQSGSAQAEGPWSAALQFRLASIDDDPIHRVYLPCVVRQNGE